MAGDSLKYYRTLFDGPGGDYVATACIQRQAPDQGSHSHLHRRGTGRAGRLGQLAAVDGKAASVHAARAL